MKQNSINSTLPDAHAAEMKSAGALWGEGNLTHLSAASPTYFVKAPTASSHSARQQLFRCFLTFSHYRIQDKKAANRAAFLKLIYQIYIKLQSV
ncbi:protein of unknown function [Bacillus velezensis]|nr:protein of unknown function [Bacillus velezensis]